jgi:hypothetical protein
MEVAAAILTLIVVMANSGGAGTPASAKDNVPRTAERNAAEINGGSVPVCSSNTVIYRDLTLPWMQEGEAPEPEANEAIE